VLASALSSKSWQRKMCGVDVKIVSVQIENIPGGDLPSTSIVSISGISNGAFMTCPIKSESLSFFIGNSLNNLRCFHIFERTLLSLR
jgi:hypothetical protein